MKNSLALHRDSLLLGIIVQDEVYGGLLACLQGHHTDVAKARI